MSINDITKGCSFHATFADKINLHMFNSCFNVLQTSVNLQLFKIDHWLIFTLSFSFLCTFHFFRHESTLHNFFSVLLCFSFVPN